MNNLIRHSIGVHLSIKDSLLNLFAQAENLEITTLACFTASNLRYEFKNIENENIIEAFLKIKKTKNYTIFAHAAYLINIANKDNHDIYNKSMLALNAEIKRCNQLGISGVAFHPGSNINRQAGLESIVYSLNNLEILHKGNCKLLIESSAGQGNTLPTSFEEIAFINNGLNDSIKNKIEFVFDTCHIFAAGYDLSNDSFVNDTLNKYDNLIGLNRIGLIHLNDSKQKCGSKIDRHETLGKGYIGIEGLIYFLNHPKIKKIPKILETPINNYLEWKVELGLINSLLN